MKNENTTVLKLSLLPLVILIILIVGAGYFLLQDEIKLPKFNKGPTIKRLEGFPTLVYTDKETEKGRQVITNEEDLNNFLNAIDETGLLEFRDSVNFDKEVLLAVNSSMNEETGHRIKIKKVYENKDEGRLIVIVEETEQGETCTTDPDTNVTVDIVALSKTDMKIDFDKVKKVEECD